jgi:hypothetical protein
MVHMISGRVKSCERSSHVRRRYLLLFSSVFLFPPFSSLLQSYCFRRISESNLLPFRTELPHHITTRLSQLFYLPRERHLRAPALRSWRSVDNPRKRTEPENENEPRTRATNMTAMATRGKKRAQLEETIQEEPEEEVPYTPTPQAREETLLSVSARSSERATPGPVFSPASNQESDLSVRDLYVRDNEGKMKAVLDADALIS